MTAQLRVALVGAGYWGPNLARNFAASDDWNLVAVCDPDNARARAVAAANGDVAVHDSLSAAIANHHLDAVAIATPARTHHGIAMTAIAAGLHVLVEKPLADSSDRGAEMVDAAQAEGLVLMADHTYCYTPAVLKIRELIANGSLGDILFVDAVRINLGLIQPDVDVFWDLAPHDLSILDFVLPGGLRGGAVAAQGSDPLHAGRSCVGYFTLPLGSGAVATVHVNWLSPTKIRRMVIGGSKRTLVWDDLNPVQRLSVFDRGVDLGTSSVLGADKRTAAISYRLGDTWSPALPEREPLRDMVSEFAASIREGRAPRTDGRAALRVLSVLEAIRSNLDDGGQISTISAPALRLEDASWMI
ncbi:Gfo/Idh/MocA family oxidoreductase [Microbacteriaceae bacterium VKM Ac-2855]|nr:Gfo/Idh/MocA family oxidoreductase [Microbacteriaceae bacterium VKM Ac-2855]